MKYLTLFACAAALITGFAYPTSAADGALTREAIERFYAESAVAHKKPLDEYLAFLADHTDDDAKIELNITVTVKTPNTSPITQVMTFDKRKLLDQSREGYQDGHDMTITNKIAKIDMAADGKTAMVMDETTMEDPRAEIPDVQGQWTMQGKTRCSDTLGFKPGIGVQVIQSACTAELDYYPSQEL